MPPDLDSEVPSLEELVEALKAGREAEKQIASLLNAAGARLPDVEVKVPGLARPLDLVKLAILVVIAVKVLFFDGHATSPATSQTTSPATSQATSGP